MTELIFFVLGLITAFVIPSIDLAWTNYKLRRAERKLGVRPW